MHRVPELDACLFRREHAAVLAGAAAALLHPLA
jgi:hypothetical protein